MSETKAVHQTTVPPVQEDGAARIIYRAKSFWEKFGRIVIYTGIAIIVIAAGWFAYQKLIAGPKAATANDAIWKAQQYFEKDSIRLALKGDGKNPGFEKVAKNYSGTDAGNIANYYAGVCCLKLNDAKNAVTYLKNFSTGSKEIQSLAYARLGDAYADLNNNSDAINNYDKAGHYFPDDEGNSSESLFRAGLLSQVAGKNDDAVKYFKELKKKYPRTERGSKADEYLTSLGSLDND